MGAVLFWWVAFAGTHLLLSSRSVRQPVIARLGERGFQGLYSIVALATFIPLVRAYWSHKHAGPLLWSAYAVPGLRTLSIILAGLGVVLVVVSFFQPSPTGMVPTAKNARGVTRITRHPLFAGIGVWGLAHSLVNAFGSDVLFFGGFLAFFLIGGAHQDVRKRTAGAEGLESFYAETSMLPFGAILSGRNRLVAAEISWLGVGIGVVVAAILYGLHARLFMG